MSNTGIVTGEGVLLESDPASVMTRVLSAVIDYGLYSIILFCGSIIIQISYWLDSSLGAIVQVLVFAGVLVMLPALVETLSRGRSLGRLAAGTRIVRDDGGAVTFRHTLVRALIGVVEIWFTFGAMALITSMVNPKGKRLGDLAAGTYPARVRGGPRDQLIVVMPAELANWAYRADVARLPDTLALSTRQFLGRAARLHPQSRNRLGTSLTEQVQRYVRPLPPTGTHPERFLMAVLAERREREIASEQIRVARTHAEAATLARLPFGVPDVSS